MPESGTYLFHAEPYRGTLAAAIDGKPLQSGPTILNLEAGMHRFTMTGRFDPGMMEPTARFYWKGSQSGNERRLLPFYRLGPVRVDCREDLTARGGLAAEETEEEGSAVQGNDAT